MGLLRWPTDVTAKEITSRSLLCREDIVISIAVRFFLLLRGYFFCRDNF